MKMRVFTAGMLVLLLSAACGGGASDNSSPSTSGEVAGESEAGGSLDGDGCPPHGFEGVATRMADDGFGHAEGSYTGADFVDARTDITSGRSGFVYLASFDLPESLLGRPEVPAGQVLMSIYAEELDTMGPGDQWEITPNRRVPLINNGGSDGNNIDDAAGLITVIDINEDDICYTIEFSDELQQISGTVSAPWEG